MAILEERKERSLERLRGLHPIVRVLAARFLAEAQNTMKPFGFLIEITEGYRAPHKQTELVKTGKSKVGPWHSYHNYGLAFDIALYDIEKNAYNWEMVNYRTVASEALLLDFEWGGNWMRFKDGPHFQFTFGYPCSTLKHMLEEQFQGELPKLWDFLTDEYYRDIYKP